MQDSPKHTFLLFKITVLQLLATIIALSCHIIVCMTIFYLSTSYFVIAGKKFWYLALYFFLLWSLQPLLFPNIILQYSFVNTNNWVPALFLKFLEKWRKEWTMIKDFLKKLGSTTEAWKVIDAKTKVNRRCFG